MTDRPMNERDFNNHVCAEMNKLAGIFANIMNQAGDDTPISRSAHRGAMTALKLCSMAGDRNLQKELVADVAELEATGYDLAALAAAPPATIED